MDTPVIPPQNPPPIPPISNVPNLAVQENSVTQPSITTVEPPKTNRSKIIIVIVLVVVLIVIGVVVGLFFFRNSYVNSSSSTTWNPGGVDSSLFVGQTYKSGDVYLSSCFESEVPKNFEITSVGFLPKIGVVKPIGPKIDGDYYYPYIDIRFHENQNSSRDELLSEKNYLGLKSWIESLTGGNEVKDRKVSFTTVKLSNSTSKAIIVEYNHHYSQPVTTYDGKKVENASGINVFIMGKNPKIIENIKLIYETINKERDLRMFKEFVKTFKPTCFAESVKF